MKFTELELPGVILIEPDVHSDDRGFFLETWHQRKYAQGGITGPFVQDNHSHSRRGALRGLRGDGAGLRVGGGVAGRRGRRTGIEHTGRGGGPSASGAPLRAYGEGAFAWEGVDVSAQLPYPWLSSAVCLRPSAIRSACLCTCLVRDFLRCAARTHIAAHVCTTHSHSTHTTHTRTHPGGAHGIRAMSCRVRVPSLHNVIA